MKYIDSEKLTKNLRDIAASIEKRLHNIVEPQDKSSIDEEQLPQIILKNRVDKSFFNGELSFYDDVLTLIDSLQQEQSEVDLEKEFDDFLEKENAYIDDNGVISYYNGGSFNRTCDIYPIARYFFNLGLNVRKEK